MRRTFEEFGYSIHQLQNERATENLIKDLLEDVSQSLGQYTGKVIVFAFSGHGTNYDRLLTNDGKLISLKKDIIDPILNYSRTDIPKLFFIDACRGSDELKLKYVDQSGGDVPKFIEDYEKGFRRLEVNYRIDYATIPDHVSYAGRYESKWMPRLARKLRETDDTLQNIAADVKKEVYQTDSRQQCETLDRLNGRLSLYVKKN